MKLLGAILLIMGLLEIICISILSALDNVSYSSYRNHFFGFMAAYTLWPFFFGAVILSIAGSILLLMKNKKIDKITFQIKRRILRIHLRVLKKQFLLV